MIQYLDNKFWLVINRPESPEYCIAYIADDRHCSLCSQNKGCVELSAKYNRALKSCERIEIKNIEVFQSMMGLQYGLGRPLKPGDLFPIPEGIEWEIKKHSCNHTLKANEIQCPRSQVEFPDCCGDNKKFAILKLKAQPEYEDFDLPHPHHSVKTVATFKKVEVKGESQESIHDRILEQWEKDFGSITSEQKMDGYTVSGFVRAALKQ